MYHLANTLGRRLATRGATNFASSAFRAQSRSWLPQSVITGMPRRYYEVAPAPTFDLSQHGINVNEVHYNPSVPSLVESCIRFDRDTVLTSNGAVAARSYKCMGRVPAAKRIVKEASTENDVFWGDVNIPLSESSFARNKEIALDFLNSRERLYVVDALANWDDEHSLKVRVITTRPYHAMFMHNMLRRLTPEEQENFGEPDFVIYNAGQQKADPEVEGVGMDECVALNFKTNELVILGTEYAGEMKKGIFTVMHYLAPKDGNVSLHSSANAEMGKDSIEDSKTTVFFGLSGTGKTTLSACSDRDLIGDDEHIWTNTGIYNIEGGCYAKAIDLSAESEPEIFNAIKYGSVLENIVYDENTREVDYHDTTHTLNTRCCYPIEHVENARVPCVGTHPSDIVFLTCDAAGVLPPVAKLSPEQAMYHFISGYTSKVAGTEVGVTEPELTFSACFGEAFLVWHPSVYAELLAQKLADHSANAWLVNTGYQLGGDGLKRMSLADTRAIIHAIQDGSLKDVETTTVPYFNLEVPVECKGVEGYKMDTSRHWDPEEYDTALRKLAGKFVENFHKYEEGSSDSIMSGGPQL